MPNSVLGFPCGSAGKETAWSARDLGLILGLGRFPGKGYPLQDSGLKNSVDYSAWGCKELGTTKWLSLHFRIVFQGFPGGSVGKEFTFNALDAKVQFSSVQSQEMWVQFLGQEDPLEKAWQPTPVFLPGESHGQRSLTDYGPEGHKELNTTEVTEHACMQ